MEFSWCIDYMPWKVHMIFLYLYEEVQYFRIGNMCCVPNAVQSIFSPILMLGIVVSFVSLTSDSYSASVPVMFDISPSHNASQLYFVSRSYSSYSYGSILTKFPVCTHRHEVMLCGMLIMIWNIHEFHHWPHHGCDYLSIPCTNICIIVTFEFIIQSSFTRVLNIIQV